MILYLVLIFILYNISSNISNPVLQGVNTDGKYIYIIFSHGITKIKNNKIIKQIFGYQHLNSCFIINNKLYCTHNPKYSNSIEIFDLDLNLIQSIKIKTKGSLTWISYNNGWWGCLAYYGKYVNKTRIIKFINWKITQKYKIDPKILNKIKPYSLSGGTWYKNKLYLSGHDKPEIYKLNKLFMLDQIIKTNSYGQSFGIYNNILYGINRQTNKVVTTNISGYV